MGRKTTAPQCSQNCRPKRTAFSRIAAWIMFLPDTRRSPGTRSRVPRRQCYCRRESCSVWRFGGASMSIQSGDVLAAHDYKATHDKPATEEKSIASASHLKVLDGLRGYMALWVWIGHCCIKAGAEVP